MSEREDVVRELGGIEATLKSIDGSLKEIRGDFKEHKEKVEETFEKHANRIGVLEGWRWYLVGLVVGVSVIVKYIL